jgi:hypothetical protein
VYLRTALLLGIAAIGLAGCTNSASTSSLPSQSPTTVKFTGPPAAKATPIPRDAASSARAAAVQFDSIYYASKFAASWHLLSADARRAIPERVWVRVHDGCRSARTSVTSVIKSVTVFGDAAIVTETLTTQAKRSTAENVFNYANGRWGYSPENLSIYHRGSVSADIAAARAAGLCASQQPFLPNKGGCYRHSPVNPVHFARTVQHAQGSTATVVNSWASRTQPVVTYPDRPGDVGQVRKSEARQPCASTAISIVLSL